MADKKEKDEEEKPEGEADGEGGPEIAEGEGEGGEGKAGMDKKKLILFIVLPVLVLIGVGAGLYFTGMLDSVLGKKVECAEDDEECKAAEEHAAEEGEGHGEEAAAEGHGEGGAAAGGHGAGASNFLAIPTMIVNLNGEDGTPRYLRLTVQLEMKNPADVATVEAVMPRVVDQFQTYLRELRVKDLRGSAGIYRLQMELLWRVNQAAAPVEVKDVLFQEVLIQ